VARTPGSDPHNFVVGLVAFGETERPALSLIVAVDKIDEGTRRSLDAMLEVIGESSCEVIVASREVWPDAPAAVIVVECIYASRGDCFDQAASTARGRILAFLDDRVCLPEDWVERVIRCFDDPNVLVAGGPVLPRGRSRAERISALMLNRRFRPSLAASLVRSDLQPNPAELSGCNLLIRNDVFRRVGGFRTSSPGGEVGNLCDKVRFRLGCTIHLHPDLAVVTIARPFPGPFLADTAVYARAQGAMARESTFAMARNVAAPLRANVSAHGRTSHNGAAPFRERTAPPFLPFIVAALIPLFVVLELLALPLHRSKVELSVGALLIALYVWQIGRVAFAKGPARIGDRVVGVVGFPIVSVTYVFAFVRGFLYTSWRP
jgi:hypothetical protein